MKTNLTKMTMMSIMITTIIMVTSSNNILFSWMSMEINLISFLPILTESKKMTDQPMKYFIVQSLSSSTMLMSILMNSIIESPLNESIILMTSMLMKMGMMPFHLWMPNLMQSMTWMNCFIMSTMQKISPTILISQTMNFHIMMYPMILSLIASPISTINQLSTKKIMAYSSISNSPWMIMSMMISKTKFIMFMIIYSMITVMIMKSMKKMNFMFINQSLNKSNKKKLSMIINILSMSGMPPMLGFVPKWIILQSMINISIMMVSSMIISSILSMFIYMKMISTMMMTASTTKKTKKEIAEKENNMTINLLTLPLMVLFKSM
uniref:NADH dehydrogenase subunit 2 n=1 Tax=Kodaianella bicinctifrons TaxID=1201171 RepID=UPI002A83985A|nr:NADH dehydrogenase subunit 2 [Kodaianella bicinctifrons]WOW98879.1 NADH dehydrogenase subunit 2 [Kodaianella bicinctifrons]